LYRDRLRYYKNKMDSRVTGEIILSFASVLEETPVGFNLRSTAGSKTYTFKSRHSADQTNWTSFIKWVIGKCKGDPPTIVHPKQIEVREVLINRSVGDASQETPSFISKDSKELSINPSSQSQPSPHSMDASPSPFAMAHSHDTKTKPVGSLSPRSQNNNPFTSPEKVRSPSSEQLHASSSSSNTISPSSPTSGSGSTQTQTTKSPIHTSGSQQNLSNIEKNPVWEKFLKKLKKKKNRTFEDIRHVDREMFSEMVKSLGFKDVWEVADLLRVFGALTNQGGEQTTTS